MKKLFFGSESLIYEIDEKTLRKERIEKKYMLKKIEINLRKKRNRKEFKILQKLYLKKVNVPKPYKIFEDERKEKFYFEFEKILGKTLFEKISEKNLKCAFLQIIKIHNLDVIHTDLTSKNMIEKNGKVYLIDFGLSFISSKIEDKASDLNLFFKCLKNEHKNFFYMKELFEKTYIKKAECGEKIIEQLYKVEKRGRNKNGKK